MIGYFDLASGISGDMMLGCLVDAGWGVEELCGVVTRLHLDPAEWSVSARPVTRGALRATLVEVSAAESHHQRHLGDIQRLLESSSLPATVVSRASSVFGRLARAEAKVHNTTPDRIHFHEVGAVDAIIDIVGTIAGLEALDISQVFSSPLPLGGGWIESAHGVLPLPAPATLELLSAASAPTTAALGPGEWVTPTGAALVAELAGFSQPAFTLARVGVGAGHRDAAWPNVARLWIGEPLTTGGLVQVDTNIDDMNPQLYGAVSERLFAAGAKDVWLTPVQMKKGRPGVVLSVIASASSEGAIADVVLRETTTLGVRVHRLTGRHEVRHEKRIVDTLYGPIGVKVKWLENTPIGATPEYEECAALARGRSASVKAVVEAAAAAAHGLLAELSAGRRPSLSSGS
ncbi:MAG: nickel pincer cofactor biosynthesis protein LarC [Acidobacteria bacterium]|nr:nickel pincer cofactor biosynthesis protein LarC [Acidobacteriota bacterium]